MKRNAIGLSVVTGLCCLALLGCSKGGSGQSVSGVVTLDGTPLEDAEVVFDSQDRTKMIGGDTVKTDGQGKFEVKPDKQKAGLKPGKFGVYVSKWVDKKTKKAPPAEDAEMQKASGTLMNIVPPKYSARDQPPLVTIEVKPGKNDNVEIKLASK